VGTGTLRQRRATGVENWGGGFVFCGGVLLDLRQLFCWDEEVKNGDAKGKRSDFARGRKKAGEGNCADVPEAKVSVKRRETAGGLGYRDGCKKRQKLLGRARESGGRIAITTRAGEGLVDLHMEEPRNFLNGSPQAVNVVVKKLDH